MERKYQVQLIAIANFLLYGEQLEKESLMDVIQSYIPKISETTLEMITPKELEPIADRLKKMLNAGHKKRDEKFVMKHNKVFRQNERNAIQNMKQHNIHEE